MGRGASADSQPSARAERTGRALANELPRTVTVHLDLGRFGQSLDIDLPATREVAQMPLFPAPGRPALKLPALRPAPKSRQGAQFAGGVAGSQHLLVVLPDRGLGQFVHEHPVVGGPPPHDP